MSPLVEIISDCFPWVYWYIWIARNQLIFEGRTTTPEDTVSKSIWSARKWFLAQPNNPFPSQTHGPYESLITPDQDDLTICYSDAVWRNETNMAGFGCIFMDNAGVTDYQVTRVERNIASPLVAEALALRWALLTAHTQEYSKICFKTDCQALLAAISSEVFPADPLDHPGHRSSISIFHLGFF